MKNFIKTILTISIFSFYNVGAQEVTKIDTIDGTELTLSMDSRINDAITSMEENCNRKSTAGNTNILNTGTTIKTPRRILVPNRELTNAEICRKNPRILGYKIQLVVVKSNEEANEVKAYFRRRFPNIKAETDASLRPNYKILAGSYFNKQSASKDLAKIREYFKSAISVQYSIFCEEAK